MTCSRWAKLPRLQLHVSLIGESDMAVLPAQRATIPYTLPAKSGGEYEITPEGTYQGFLSRVQYFGTHTAENDKGQKYDQAKIVLVFEIDYRKDGQEKNRLISTGWPMTYSLSSKSNLTKLIKPWLGSRFPSEDNPAGLDWDLMMDEPVMISISHETRKNKEGIEKTYDKISGLSRPPKGMPPFLATQDQWSWSIIDDPELKVAEELKMPKFLIDFAKQSKEYRARERDAQGRALDEAAREVFSRSSGRERQPGEDDDGEFVF